MKSLWKRSFVKFYIVYTRLRGYRYLRSERRIRKKKDSGIDDGNSDFLLFKHLPFAGFRID